MKVYVVIPIGSLSKLGIDTCDRSRMGVPRCVLPGPSDVSVDADETARCGVRFPA